MVGEEYSFRLYQRAVIIFLTAFSHQYSKPIFCFDYSYLNPSLAALVYTMNTDTETSSKQIEELKHQLAATEKKLAAAENDTDYWYREHTKRSQSFIDSIRLNQSLKAELFKVNQQLTELRERHEELKQQRQQPCSEELKIQLDRQEQLSLLQIAEINKILRFQATQLNRFYRITSLDWLQRCIHISIRTGLNRDSPEEELQPTTALLLTELRQVLQSHFKELCTLQRPAIRFIRRAHQKLQSTDSYRCLDIRKKLRSYSSASAASSARSARS